MAIEDWDKLLLEPPDQLMEAPPDFAEKLWERLQRERREERMQRIRKIARDSRYAAAAVVILGFGIVWMSWRTSQQATPTMARKPTSADRPNAVRSVSPSPAPSVSPSAAPTAVAAVTAPRTPAHKKAAVRPKHEVTPPTPNIASAPVTPVPDTNDPFPAPPPRKLKPYRPNIDLAVGKTGPDGETVTPPQQPMIYYRKGTRHPPVAPPGTPRLHDEVTVTPPPATATTDPATTTNPPAETTTTNPPTGTQQ